MPPSRSAQRLLTSALAAAGLLALAAPAAHGATARADLRATALSSPTATVVQGGRVTAAVTVRNRGRAAGRATVSLTLRTSPRSRAARTLTKTRTARLNRGGSVRLAGRYALPAGTPAGTYRLVACMKAAGRKAACRTGRSIVVTAAPARTPAPAPAPAPTPAPTPTPTPVAPSDALRAAITPDRLRGRLEDLQSIASANEGTRASGTPGFDQSLGYVVGVLRAAGYSPRIQPFSFDSYEQTGPSTFAQTAPAARTFTEDEDFATLEYAGSGTVTDTEVVPVDINLEGDRASTSGCEPEDFPAAVKGRVALVQRGTCTFAQKAANATAAGAAGIVFFNQGDDPADPERTGIPAVTIGERQSIPSVGTTYAIGAELAAPGTRVSFSTQTSTTTRTTANVTADTPGGDPTRTVVVGSHLDSVTAGPGINDDGSGSAFNLELAVQMAAQGIQPANRVRFAWWGAEEEGLLGSTYYTAQLSDAEAADVALDLNFDMLGSPNFARLIYDGDGDAFGQAGPAGSDVIEHAFEGWFRSKGQGTGPTAFDGRSDYAGFIDRGIPAGGLFSGAEDIKSEEQAALFGGVAGTAFDANYHQAGDTVDNVNFEGYKQLVDGAIDVTAKFATGELAVPARTARAAQRSAAAPARAFRGSQRIR